MNGRAFFLRAGEKKENSHGDNARHARRNGRKCRTGGTVTLNAGGERLTDSVKMCGVEYLRAQQAQQDSYRPKNGREVSAC